MERKIVGLVIGIMLIGVNLFAADGDVIVNGNIGVGTTNPQAKVDVNGNLKVDGRVGIGETSPSVKLTVKTTGQGTDGIKLTDGTSFLYVGVNSTENDYNPLVSAGNKAIIFSDGSMDTGILVIGPWTDTAKGIKMNIGRVGIGANPPTSYKLYVSGSAYSTGGWLTSDLKFKEGIQPITSPLDKVQTIRGVSFTWKADQYKDMDLPGGRHYGVIAQEIEKVLPEVVNDSGSEKAVSYSEIIPVLIEAIKEQQKQIESLKSEVQELKKN